jgi:3-oxoadipate enol-lactonase
LVANRQRRSVERRQSRGALVQYEGGGNGVPYATTNGIRTFYEEEGDGPTLVLVHGYTADATMWLRARPHLALQYRLICYDTRGHGRSDAPEDQELYTMAAYAEDLRALLQALDIPAAHICGVSMGGMVALEFAFRYPELVRGLVLSDTSAGPSCIDLSDAIRRREEQIAESEAYAAEHGIEALALRQLESARMPAAVRQDPYLRERFLSRMRALTTHGFVNASRARRERSDYRERLGELAMPVLVIAGEQDVLVPAAEELHAGIPGSRLEIIADAGHPAVSDQPDAFCAAVLRFLRELDGEGTAEATSPE